MILSSKDYRLSALSLSAAVEFRLWVRNEVMWEAKHRIELLQGLLDPSEKRAILQNALMLIDSGQAEKTMADAPEGKRMIVWLSLRPAHPEVTLAQAGELVPQFAGNVKALDEMLAVANGLGGDDAEQEPAELPAPTPAETEAKPDLRRMPPDEARKTVFDGMCQANELTPQDLVDLPIAAAEALYFKQVGKPIPETFDRLRLKAYLLDYAAKAQPATDPAEMPANVQAVVDAVNAGMPATLDGVIGVAKSEVIGKAELPVASE